MRHIFSVTTASITAGLVILSVAFASAAGDCNKTVMGGGCAGQVEGVPPHMQSQNPLNPVTKAKTSTAAPAPKTAAQVKHVKG